VLFRSWIAWTPSSRLRQTASRTGGLSLRAGEPCSMVPEEAALASSQIKQLQEIEIHARALDGVEVIQLLQGDTTMINDWKLRAERKIATPRVLRRVVPEAYKLYQSLYKDPPVDPKTGKPLPDISPQDFMREAFTDAFSDYDGPLDVHSIRKYLNETESAAPAKDVADRLDRLMDLVELMGLTPREQASVASWLLEKNNVSPDGLEWQELFRIIRAEPTQ